MILYCKKSANHTQVKGNAKFKKCNFSLLFLIRALYYWDTRYRSWLRPITASRKVAGSIPDGIFH
jgi:hypothetical protein